MQRRAGEGDVGHVAHALVGHLRRNQIRAAAGQHLPGLVEVEQRRAEGVDIAVARAQHAVVEEQPPLRGLDGDGARTDFHALPGAHLECGGRHHVAVVSPVLHVGAFGVEDVAEGGVARVARTRQHGELAVNLAGEHHAVAVVGQEGVLQLVEGLEVGRPGHADGGAVVAVAPRHVVLVVDFGHTRVIAVDPLPHFGVGTLEVEILLLDVPVDAVDREADVNPHPAVGVVAAKDTRIVVLAVLEGNDRRVEDAVRGRKQVARDNRVGRIAPEHLFRAGGTLLPRHVRKRRTCDFQIAVHEFTLVYWLSFPFFESCRPTHQSFFSSSFSSLDETSLPSGWVKGTNHVMRKAGMVANITAMKKNL